MTLPCLILFPGLFHVLSTAMCVCVCVRAPLSMCGLFLPTERRWRAWSGTVLQERLLVIRDMGIQLSAHCASGKCKRQVFLDTTELEHIVINEGFRLWRIIFYLTAIMRPSSPPPRVPKILSSIPATLTSSIRPPSSDAPQNELLVTDSGGKLALQHQQQLQRRSQRKSRPAASAAGLRPKPYFEMGKSSQETVLGPTDRRLVLLFEVGRPG